MENPWTLFTPCPPYILMMTKRPKTLPLWQITRIRKKGEPLGKIRARDQADAIKLWIEEHDVTDPFEQKRLMAQPAIER